MTNFSNQELKALQQLTGISDETQLFLGQLPEDLPVNLPFPNGAQMVGSLCINFRQFNILFDTSLSLDQVKTFYKQRLIEPEWQELIFTSPTYKGFQAAPVVVQTQVERNLRFRAVSKAIELNIQCSPCPDSTNQTSVTLMLAPLPYPEPLGVLDLPPFPPLADPPDATRLRSHGSTFDECASHVYLTSSLELSELFIHYANQFEDANWIESDRGQAGPTNMWGSWTIQTPQGQVWISHLNVIKLGGIQHQYIALARVSRQQPRPLDGG